MSRKEIKLLATIAICALVVCLVVECWGPISGFLITFGKACIPVIAGLAFAFAANIPMAFIERHLAPNSTSTRMIALRRPLSLALTLVLFAVAAVLIMIAVIPQFAEAVILLQRHIPEYIEALRGSIGSDLLDSVRGLLVPSGGQAEGDGSFAPQDAMRLLQNAGGFIGDLANGVVSFATSAASLVMSALLSISLLAEKETFQTVGMRSLRAYLGAERSGTVLHVLGVFDRTFRGFLVKQFADALVIGVLCVLGMMLLGLPYATAVGTLLGLSALIPMIGVYAGMVLGALLVFAASPTGALAFLVLALVVTNVEASFISPQITAQTLGIPGIWVLIAITIFGAVWGILGILVGVPTFAALYRLLHEDLDRREAMPVPDHRQPDAH